LQLFPLASISPWIAKGETLNSPADVLAAIPHPGRDNPVPGGGFIQEWWAASSRYGGRHNLGIVGGFVRNQHSHDFSGANLEIVASMQP
jgi:hypothetical protein